MVPLSSLPILTYSVTLLLLLLLWDFGQATTTKEISDVYVTFFAMDCEIVVMQFESEVRGKYLGLHNDDGNFISVWNIVESVG